MAGRRKPKYYQAFRYAGGDTRTPDTRIMMEIPTYRGVSSSPWRPGCKDAGCTRGGRDRCLAEQNDDRRDLGGCAGRADVFGGDRDRALSGDSRSRDDGSVLAGAVGSVRFADDDAVHVDLDRAARRRPDDRGAAGDCVGEVATQATVSELAGAGPRVDAVAT